MLMRCPVRLRQETGGRGNGVSFFFASLVLNHTRNGSFLYVAKCRVTIFTLRLLRLGQAAVWVASTKHASAPIPQGFSESRRGGVGLILASVRNVVVSLRCCDLQWVFGGPVLLFFKRLDFPQFYCTAWIRVIVF